MRRIQLHWLVWGSCRVKAARFELHSVQKTVTSQQPRGSLSSCLCSHNTNTKPNLKATNLTTPMCKQPTIAVYHILHSYLVRQMSSTGEAWGSVGTLWILGRLFSESKKAEIIIARRKWKKRGADIHRVAVVRRCSHGEGDAYLYSQNVSSFMPWDSTSGWRSSFSFTVHKVMKRDERFPQETPTAEVKRVAWVLSE